MSEKCPNSIQNHIRFASKGFWIINGSIKCAHDLTKQKYLFHWLQRRLPTADVERQSKPHTCCWHLRFVCYEWKSHKWDRRARARGKKEVERVLAVIICCIRFGHKLLDVRPTTILANRPAQNKWLIAVSPRPINCLYVQTISWMDYEQSSHSISYFSNWMRSRRWHDSIFIVRSLIVSSDSDSDENSKYI